MPSNSDCVALNSLNAGLRLVANRVDRVKDLVRLIQLKIANEANSTVASPSEARRRQVFLHEELIKSQENVIFHQDCLIAMLEHRDILLSAIADSVN